MGTIESSPLGRATHYPDHYDAGLLYPVERALQREALGITGAPPFGGNDRWRAWEVMWLDGEGRPRAAIATFDVPCTSPRIVESKSVKLWLASLNHARFDTPERLRETLSRDLSRGTGARIDVVLDLPDSWERHARREPIGEPIDDDLPIAMPAGPDSALLRTHPNSVDESLVSRTFRSVCPVTSQPDYACVSVCYRGLRIDRASLASYLGSYYNHPGFHEHCVERIFLDLLHACLPLRLTVEAQFTRRGGIDISPLRTNAQAQASASPTLRQ